MERNYQNMALQLDQLDGHLVQFLHYNPNVTILQDDIAKDIRTIKLGHPGVYDATVILHFKKGGLTTIQFKTGKNQTLGKTLADFLYETVDPNENKNDVNISLKGIDTESVQALLDNLGSTLDDSGNAEFTISARPINNHSTKYEIISNNYKDHLVITHHRTGSLQVQGQRLFCFRKLLPYLTLLEKN